MYYTFEHLVFIYILNSICNHGKFDNYYFMRKYAIHAFIKFVKNILILRHKVCYQNAKGEDTPKIILVFKVFDVLLK